MFWKLIYSINFILLRLIEVTEFTTNSSSAEHNFLSEVVIYEEDVYTALSNLDTVKAARCDDIIPKIDAWNLCRLHMQAPLLSIF